MPPFQIESWSKSLINNEFDLHEYEYVGGTHLLMVSHEDSLCHRGKR